LRSLNGDEGGSGGWEHTCWLEYIHINRGGKCQERREKGPRCDKKTRGKKLKEDGGRKKGVN